MSDGGGDYGGDTGCSFETFDAGESAGNYESNDYGGDTGNYESNDYGGDTGGYDTAVSFETFDAEGTASNDNGGTSYLDNGNNEDSSFCNNINSERIIITDLETDCVGYNTHYHTSRFTPSYRPRNIPYVRSNRPAVRTTYVSDNTSNTTAWAIFVGATILFIFIVVLVFKR